jgi:hypothetical protein
VSDFLPEGAAAVGVAVLMTVAVAVLLGETMAEAERTEGTMRVKREGMRGGSEREKGAWSNENCASDRQVTCKSVAKRSPLFLTRALTEEALFDSSRSEGDTIARYGMIISCFMVTMLTIGG